MTIGEKGLAASCVLGIRVIKGVVVTARVAGIAETYLTIRARL